MKRLFAFVFTAFLSTFVLAQDMAPDVLVRTVTEDVLAAVRQDKDIQNGNTQKTIALIQTKVLPYFNFQRMTSLAVGRDWRQATPQQKEMLARQFQELLVRTYSNALSSYRDQTVRYRPFKMNPGETDVLVRTEVLQPGGRPIQLDYSLEKSDKGWKVYDVVVAGVSLVTNYRETFAQEIRAGGIDGLIRSLEAKNKSLAAGKAA
ncbi:phospholipid-binding protein MlaC [Azovibrio restrictus]|uniref:MlaC/ttg2D family ABC transporter substrate-binding protein n=1 Tax=Azovibrio restrictus TaxID=146938 RepID=UPI0026F01009|nr:ABC transporter substrate-binding protein [Azovibrio restrictus]